MIGSLKTRIAGGTAKKMGAAFGAVCLAGMLGLPGVAFADQGALQAATPTSGSTALREQSDVQATYTVAVRAIKQGQENAEENLSMMRVSLYSQAYVERYSDTQYAVTFYFRDAEVMGQTVYCESLGEASYLKEGSDSLVPAERDEYDPLTHTKSVTVTVSDLSKPIPVNVKMGTADMYLDLSSMVEGQAPVFPQIKLAEGIFKGEILGVIGGTGSDSPSECATLSNGDVVVVGSTTSTNQDFAGHSNNKRAAFIALTTSDGDLLSANALEGAALSGLSSVSAAEDDSFFVAGYYQNDSAPSGDFEGLNGVDAPGRDAFVAKYDSQGKRLWARSISSSFTEQFEKVIATSDGGCVASAEVMFNQGKEYDGNIDSSMPGMVNAVVVKYDKDGNKQWDVAVGCKGITDPQGGLALKADGSYLLMVERTASNGFFEGAPFYGEGVDGETRFVDFELGAVSISKDGEASLIGAYGGNLNDSMNSVIATSDGGFAFVGYTESSTQTFAGHTGSGDAGYLVKCSADGSVEWVSMLESSGDSSLNSVVETQDGYVAVGSAEGDDGDFESLSKGGSDAVVATFDKQGGRTSLRTFGGTKDDGASQVALCDDDVLVLVDSNSTDVHLKGINRGSYDAVMLKTSLEDAQEELADRMAAAVFMQQVDRLTDVDPLNDAEVVQAARAAYESLSADAKSFVASTSLDTLAASEAAVAEADLAFASVKFGDERLVYTGLPHEASVTVVSKNGSTLKRGKDYELAYSNNVDAGTATVTVTGKGAYGGTVSASFAIERAKVATPSGKTLTYTGKQQVGVAAGDGYALSGNTATSGGSYTAVATLDKNHQWNDGATAAKKIAWKISAAEQTVKAKAKTATLAANKKTKKLAKNKKIAATVVKKGVSAKTAVSYSKVKANKKAQFFTVSKNGRITVKKGLAKGVYKLTLRATAKATANYQKAAKTFVVTIKVK